MIENVRLNLINHLVGFILYQFTCNLALRNPVFRWESCKGSVWESVKKCSKLCTKVRTRNWISRVARDWQAARGCTRVKHAEKLNRHASCSTTGQKVQTGHSVNSPFGLVTRSSHKVRLPVHFVLKNLLFAFLSHSSINTPSTHEILRASSKNFERETLEKNKIDSSTIFT